MPCVTTQRLGPAKTPFEQLGEARSREIAALFYDHMDAHEPDLARVHVLDEAGKVQARTRERFSDFLVEWLGGPPIYSSVNGHPRLRMRHATVAVDQTMRDAWLRCMASALDTAGVEGDVRVFLDRRFSELADHLRNR